MAHGYKSLEEIKRMIDRLEGLTEGQRQMVKRIAEISFDCQNRYDK